MFSGPAEERKKPPMTLYELTEEFLRLQQWLEEEDTEEDQALTDTLEMISKDFEDKADSYGCVVKNLEADIAEIKAQEDILMDEVKRLKAKRAGIEKNTDRMKEALRKALELTGKKNLKTEKFTFGTRSASSVVIDAKNIFDIPDDYLRYKDPEPDKTAIKDFLKNNPDCEWAHMETKVSLNLR